MRTFFLALSLVFAHLVDAQQKEILKIDSLNKAAYDLVNTDESATLKLLEDAIKLSRKENYEKGLHRAYITMGLLLGWRQQLDTSFYYLQKAHDYFSNSEVSDARLNLGRTKLYLGQNYDQLRDYDKAKLYFDEAEELLIQSDQKKYLIYINNSRGIIEGRQGNYEQALEFFLLSYKTSLEIDFRLNEVLGNLSIVYRRLKNYNQALNFSQQAFKVNSTKADTSRMASSLNSIANIYAETDRRDSALYYYTKSHRLYQSIGRSGLTPLINASQTLRELDRPKEALALMRSVYETKSEAEKLNLLYRKEKYYQEIAHIFLDQRRLDSAIAYLKHGYHIAEDKKNYEASRDLSRQLAETYNQIGKHDSAYTYLRRFGIFQDTIVERRNSKKIADLRVRIETQEKENEISLLQKEAQVERLKKERLQVMIVSGLLFAVGIILFLVYRQKAIRRHDLAEKNRLQVEVEQANSNLHNQTLHMIHVNNALDEVETQLREYSKKGNQITSLAKIMSTIRVNKSLEKDWENFNEYFGKIHTDFYAKLTGISADLTVHQKKVCAMLKLNLSNREIATVMNIDSRSVIMNKYRIKKILNLDKEESLEEFVQRL